MSTAISSSDLDAIVGFSTASHPFRLPKINAGSNTSFIRSFKTVASHPSAQELMLRADHSREALATALVSGSGCKIVSAASTYVPQIYEVMVTCIAQPDMARLDDRLVFEWTSSLEVEAKRGKKQVFYKSEAMMYDMVLTIASQAFAEAQLANADAKAEQYVEATKHYKSASGAMSFLANEQLPKWAGQGNDVFDHNLPCETSIEVCEAFAQMFLAMAQQMAVATVLRKPGEPNLGLLAKLSLGVAEKFEECLAIFRGKATKQLPRIDPSIIAYVEAQGKFHRSLSECYQARCMWDKILLGELLTGYGTAIVMLRESIAVLGKLPKGSLSKSDLNALLKHLKTVLASWEKDNNTIYFEQPPKSVSEDQKLSQGTFMVKAEEYIFVENAAPVPLMLPARKMPLNSLMRGIGIRG
uniref:pH-response regulator protein palC n=1 Tax=Minutocellus polymorphus TaxID=265543 RepID=A0A7S0AH76_9STRA|mmetsp:Transcript_12928/g.21554  ORF Transcript_12928/g.21554 Transcript_12928/m.21554 type:complete len:413 (+) Transcript_12928:90-1328(+)